MASPNILTLTKANFAAEVLKSAQPVLVDFWADWCGPCKMIAPVLDELATDFAGRARVGKVNIDEAPELAAQYGVQSIPTLLFFKGGQVSEQLVGAKSKRELKSILDRLSA
jgi:thioredoxin 1